MTAPPNLCVEFIVPHYFLSLLDWSGLGAVVYWKDGTRTIGDIRRDPDGRPNWIEVCTEEGERAGDIEDVLKIVVL